MGDDIAWSDRAPAMDSAARRKLGPRSDARSAAETPRPRRLAPGGAVAEREATTLRQRSSRARIPPQPPPRSRCAFRDDTCAALRILCSRNYSEWWKTSTRSRSGSIGRRHRAQKSTHLEDAVAQLRAEVGPAQQGRDRQDPQAPQAAKAAKGKAAKAQPELKGTNSKDDMPGPARAQRMSSRTLRSAARNTTTSSRGCSTAISEEDRACCARAGLLASEFKDREQRAQTRRAQPSPGSHHRFQRASPDP